VSEFQLRRDVAELSTHILDIASNPEEPVLGRKSGCGRPRQREAEAGPGSTGVRGVAAEQGHPRTFEPGDRRAC
jgi:hypothetical protein